MANMSYCRFRNTLSDLRDCIDALNDEGIDGIEDDEERHAAIWLVKKCGEVHEDFIEEVNDLEEELG